MPDAPRPIAPELLDDLRDAFRDAHAEIGMPDPFLPTSGAPPVDLARIPTGPPMHPLPMRKGMRLGACAVQDAGDRHPPGTVYLVLRWFAEDGTEWCHKTLCNEWPLPPGMFPQLAHAAAYSWTWERYKVTSADRLRLRRFDSPFHA